MTAARAWAVAAACVVALGWVAEAPGKAAKPHKAVVQLERSHAAIAAVAAGPERVRRACGDGEKLRGAVAGLPRAVPAGAPVDNDVWRVAVGSLALAVENLVAACQAPDQKLKHINGEIETAEQCLAKVDAEIKGVLDQTRPRDLLPAMKKFKTTLQRVVDEPNSRKLCARRAELEKLLVVLEIPPPRTNTQGWEQAYARIDRNLDEIHENRCGKQRGAEVELVDAVTQVHDGFYQLVLQLPPRGA